MEERTRNAITRELGGNLMTWLVAHTSHRLTVHFTEIGAIIARLTVLKLSNIDNHLGSLSHKLFNDLVHHSRSIVVK